jgi:hypothetical protein
LLTVTWGRFAIWPPFSTWNLHQRRLEVRWERVLRSPSDWQSKKHSTRLDADDFHHEVILAEHCYPVLLAVSAALFLAAGGFLMSRD